MSNYGFFMNKLRKILSSKFLLGISIFLSSCSFNDINRIPNGKATPERIQFHPEKKDTYKFDVSIKEPSTYAVTLIFYSNGRPKRTDYIFGKYPTSNENEAKLYESFVSKNSNSPANGNNALQLKISILDKRNTNLIVDTIVQNPYLNSSWGGRRGYLVATPLAQGEYEIVIKSISSDVKLEHFYSELLIEKVNIGK